MLKPSKSDWQESFKNKIGRNSIVLGHFKCSKSWPLRILRETVAYFPSLIAIWLTFSIGFCNGLFLSNLLEPQRAAQGVGFRGSCWGPEEATMAGQPFQQHLKGRSVQELLCHGEAPDLVL
jgi:hypothetical protein